MSVDSFYKPCISAGKHLVGMGDIKSRVQSVLLDFLKLLADPIPPEIEAEFSEIKKFYSRAGEFGNSNQVVNYINNLSDIEVAKISDKLYHLVVKVIELDAIEGYKIDNKL